MKTPTPDTREYVVKFLKRIDNIRSGEQSGDTEAELGGFLDTMNQEMASEANGSEATDDPEAGPVECDQFPIALAWAGLVSHCVLYTYATAAPYPTGILQTPATPWAVISNGMLYISQHIFKKLERVATNLRNFLAMPAKNAGAASFSISVSSFGVISIGLSFST